jgi:sarcosine oxidase gamma subunit
MRCGLVPMAHQAASVMEVEEAAAREAVLLRAAPGRATEPMVGMAALADAAANLAKVGAAAASASASTGSMAG